MSRVGCGWKWHLLAGPENRKRQQQQRVGRLNMSLLYRGAQKEKGMFWAIVAQDARSLLSMLACSACLCL